MIIGVPKEIKNNEFRVAITAAGVHEFLTHGHTVLVERGAGLGSGITDEDTRSPAPKSSTRPMTSGPARTWS